MPFGPPPPQPSLFFPLWTVILYSTEGSIWLCKLLQYSSIKQKLLISGEKWRFWLGILVQLSTTSCVQRILMRTFRDIRCGVFFSNLPSKMAKLAANVDKLWALSQGDRYQKPLIPIKQHMRMPWEPRNSHKKIGPKIAYPPPLRPLCTVVLKRGVWGGYDKTSTTRPVDMDPICMIHFYNPWVKLDSWTLFVP